MPWDDPGSPIDATFWKRGWADLPSSSSTEKRSYLKPCAERLSLDRAMSRTQFRPSPLSRAASSEKRGGSFLAHLACSFSGFFSRSARRRHQRLSLRLRRLLPFRRVGYHVRVWAESSLLAQ